MRKTRRKYFENLNAKDISSIKKLWKINCSLAVKV